jgi:hypothetical protein
MTRLPHFAPKNPRKRLPASNSKKPIICTYELRVSVSTKRIHQRRCSGSGCGCLATYCLQWARCSWRGTSSSSSGRFIPPWQDASSFRNPRRVNSRPNDQRLHRPKPHRCIAPNHIDPSEASSHMPRLQRVVWHLCIAGIIQNMLLESAESRRAL